MTTFNTDYSNTELLDQELTSAELSQVSGGCFGRATLEGYPEGCPEGFPEPGEGGSGAPITYIYPSQQVNHQPYPQDQYIVRRISVVANL